MPEKDLASGTDSAVRTEIDQRLLPWCDLFLAVVARSRLGGVTPGQQIYQGTSQLQADNSSVGVKIKPSYVYNDGLPRLVVVNLYAVEDKAELHIQQFFAASVWRSKAPIVQAVEETRFVKGPVASIEEAGKIALDVALNLNPLIYITPSVIQ